MLGEQDVTGDELTSSGFDLFVLLGFAGAERTAQGDDGTIFGSDAQRVVILDSHGGIAEEQSTSLVKDALAVVGTLRLLHVGGSSSAGGGK